MFFSSKKETIDSIDILTTGRISIQKEAIIALAYSVDQTVIKIGISLVILNL